MIFIHQLHETFITIAKGIIFVSSHAFIAYQDCGQNFSNILGGGELHNM
jgi:hypothetical protein